MAFDRDDTVFKVVVNHEEQYSIWPDYKPVPEGLARGRQERPEEGMPRLYRGGLDRHAPL